MVTAAMRRPEPRGPQRGRLSSKGQVVIPKSLRDWAGLRHGDEVAFQAQPDGSIRIERPQPDASPFARFRGAWRDKGVTAAAIRAMRRPEMDIPPESDHS